MQTNGHCPPSIEQRTGAIRDHLLRSVQWKGPIVGILEMRRHYTNYLKGFPYIKEFRNQLVQKKSVEGEEVLSTGMKAIYRNTFETTNALTLLQQSSPNCAC